MHDRLSAYHKAADSLLRIVQPSPFLAAVLYLKHADLYKYGDRKALDALDHRFLTSM
jgi:hypothetical protein